MLKQKKIWYWDCFQCMNWFFITFLTLASPYTLITGRRIFENNYRKLKPVASLVFDAPTAASTKLPQLEFRNETN